jgi:hypothetical protein
MPTAKPAKTAIPQFGPLADELGALEKEMSPFAQKLARIEQLRKALRAACEAPAGEEWMVTGSKFVALLGVRAMERKIDFAKLVKSIGAGVYARFATCTLKDLEARIAPAIVAAVVSSADTGSRTLKTFERGVA